MPLSSRKSQPRCRARTAAVSRKKQRITARRRRSSKRISSKVHRARRFRPRHRSRGGGYRVEIGGVGNFQIELLSPEDRLLQKIGLILDPTQSQPITRSCVKEILFHKKGVVLERVTDNIGSMSNDDAYKVIIGNLETKLTNTISIMS